MNLEWIFIKTASRARKSFSKASPYFFCEDRAGFDGDGFNAVRLFRVISEDSAEWDSLDESSAFLIEGAHWKTLKEYTKKMERQRHVATVGLKLEEEFDW